METGIAPPLLEATDPEVLEEMVSILIERADQQRAAHMRQQLGMD